MSDPVTLDFPHQINCKSRALVFPLLPCIPCSTQRSHHGHDSILTAVAVRTWLQMGCLKN